MPWVNLNLNTALLVCLCVEDKTTTVILLFSELVCVKLPSFVLRITVFCYSFIENEKTLSFCVRDNVYFNQYSFCCPFCVGDNREIAVLRAISPFLVVLC